MNRYLISCVTACWLAAASAQAWHGQGHEKATLAAVEAAGELPAFFGDGAKTVASAALDADNFTRPVAGPALHAAESSEHFFDVELLEGAAVPLTRELFAEFCTAKGIKPAKVGALPYAVAEWTQRLAIALAEHRQFPNDKAVQAKCLVYAGLLAHYAEDLCQPLHTTVHFDGRRGKDGKIVGKGIHAKLDAMLGQIHPHDMSAAKIAPLFDVAAALAATAPATGAAAISATAATSPASASAPAARQHGPAASFEKPLIEAIIAELLRSHALIDRVYELEAELPAMGEPIKSDKARAFAQDRMDAAVRFTAGLYVTAWRMSEHIKMPAWHRAWRQR